MSLWNILSGKRFDPDQLSDRERERYGRNILVREWGGEAGQLKLKQAKVLVAGAGGSGSALLLYLAAAGVGTITICDGDRVTLGNLNRQVIYNEGSIGRNKAKEAAKVLRRLNSEILVEARPYHLDADNAEALIDGCRVVCCAADDRASMVTIGRVAREKNVPVAWAGGFYMGGFLTFVSPPLTPCMECMLEIIGGAEKEIKAGRLPMRGDITLDIGGVNPIVGAAAGSAGTLQAIEVIKYIVGFGGNYLGVMLEYQLGGIGMQFNQYDVNDLRRKGCAACNP